MYCRVSCALPWLLLSGWSARPREDALGPNPVSLSNCSGELRRHQRESSESPILNAFCRVAPSVLFNFLAIFVAGVFVFAIVLSPRTSVAVQARRFLDLAIEQSSKFAMNAKGVLTCPSGQRKAHSRVFRWLVEKQTCSEGFCWKRMTATTTNRLQETQFVFQW